MAKNAAESDKWYREAAEQGVLVAKPVKLVHEIEPVTIDSKQLVELSKSLEQTGKLLKDMERFKQALELSKPFEEFRAYKDFQAGWQIPVLPTPGWPAATRSEAVGSE